MIDALYCRSTAVLLAMHVWLYVVAVLYMVSDAGRPHGVNVPQQQLLSMTWHVRSYSRTGYSCTAMAQPRIMHVNF